MTRLRWTIKRKLLALGGGTFLVLALICGFLIRREFREHTASIEAELALVSAHAALQVDVVISGITQRLFALRQTPAVQQRQAAGMEELFRETTAEHPELGNVFAVGADGRPIAAAVALPGRADGGVAGREWFRRVERETRPAVGGYEIGASRGAPVVVVAIPVHGQSGVAAGALAADVSLARLALLLRDLPVGPGVVVTVLDRDGRLLLTSGPEAEKKTGLAIATAEAAPSGGAGRTMVTWEDGGERLVGTATVTGAGWRVLAGISRTSFDRRVRGEVRETALPLFAALLISGLLGLVIARRVWRPLRALTRATAALARGERTSVPVTSSDEVGQLAGTFNMMAEQVVAARASLERRVSELTALSEAGQLLAGTLDLSEVLQRLAELARARLGLDAVRIWLRDEASGEFSLGADSGILAVTPAFRSRLGPSEGLVGWINYHREPLVLPDLPSDPRLENREWVRAEGLASFLGVPILLEDLAVGVLCCLSRNRRDFSPDDVALARLFAPPAAVAIRNARLFQEARARASQLEVLHRTAQSLAAEQDLDRLLERIVAAARELVGARYGALVVARRDDVEPRFLTDGITHEERARIGPPPMFRGLLGDVLERGRTLRVDDLAAERTAVGFPPGHPPMRTFLGTPIRFREEIVGALYLTEKPGGFTAADEAMVVALGADAAVAIENAALMARLRQALVDLRATQDRLVQGEVLRALGAMASGMAHHLNNILSVIRARVYLVLQKTEDPALRRSLEIVERAVVDGAEVIRRVQEFTRGQPVRTAVTVDLNGLAREALEGALGRSGAGNEHGGLGIETSIQAGEIPPVTGDPASLKEALGNIVQNALEALPGGGRVTVRTWTSGPWVHCSVADTGPGCPEEVRQRLLEPFFTTKGPGRRGLGLSVAHGIVRSHGGTLRVESAPDQGTTVTMALPVAREAPATAPVSAVTAPPPASPRNILIVDDEAEVRETLAEILLAEGHHVSQASDAAQGLAMARAGRYDLIFADLMIPGMSGLEMARELKTIDPATVLVLLTGWTESQALPRAGARWVDEVIEKPFDVHAIAAAVARSPEGGRP